MKKFSLFLAVVMAAMLMTGCKSSEIKVGSDDPEIAGDVLVVETTKETESTQYETVEYTIPEGATGPADVKIEANEDSIPEDKKSESQGNIIQVRYFYINSKGLNEEFDVIENGECDAAALNDLLIRTGVLVDGTEVVSFESDGTNGTLTLSQMDGQSSYATEELLSQAIANAYTDNLFLDTLTIKVGDKTYGPLEFKSGKTK